MLVLIPEQVGQVGGLKLVLQLLLVVLALAADQLVHRMAQQVYPLFLLVQVEVVALGEQEVAVLLEIPGQAQQAELEEQVRLAAQVEELYISRPLL